MPEQQRVVLDGHVMSYECHIDQNIKYFLFAANWNIIEDKIN